MKINNYSELTRHDHVCVADCFHFVHVIFKKNLIKLSEKSIQNRDNL